MKTKYKILALGAGCIALVGLVTVSSFPNSMDIKNGFLAATAKASSNTLNVFVRAPESLLRLQAPFFDFLPLKAPVIGPNISIPKSIADVITGVATSHVPLPFAASLVQHNDNPEGSVVNIFCSQKIGSGNLRRVITGSGTVINKDGTVLTNAHVAQYVLIADSDPRISCLVRTGSPAKATHSVTAAFVSPAWIRQHAQYVNASANETGESDYALVKITPTSGSKTPAPVAISYNAQIGTQLRAAAYPADVLGTKGANAPLMLQTEDTSVVDAFSFSGGQGHDIIETNDSAIGQKGASGGALINNKNELGGMITIVVNGTNSTKKRIRGITPSHISTDLGQYIPGGLQTISQDGSSAIKPKFDQAYKSELTSLLNRYITY